MITDRKPTLVHIGYHKTGSTWLQRYIFNDANRGFASEIGGPREQIVHDFVSPDVFSFSPEVTRKRYWDYQIKAEQRGCALVLSHERLSGYPPSGGYDRKVVADRLAETFPDAKVLIVIREQAALIKSMYSQYITDGGDQSIGHFLSIPEPKLGRMPYFRFEVYEYDKLISYYRSKFGAEHVLVLPFELLVSSPQDFVDRLAKFNACPNPPLGSTSAANLRRPATMQLIQRWSNRYFSRNELSATSIFAIPNFAKRFGALRPMFQAMSPKFLERALDRKITKTIADYVGEGYAESNARTSRLIGIELTAFGYPSRNGRLSE